MFLYKAANYDLDEIIAGYNLAGFLMISYQVSFLFLKELKTNYFFFAFSNFGSIFLH